MHYASLENALPTACALANTPTHATQTAWVAQQAQVQGAPSAMGCRPQGRGAAPGGTPLSGRQDPAPTGTPRWSPSPPCHLRMAHTLRLLTPLLLLKGCGAAPGGTPLSGRLGPESTGTPRWSPPPPCHLRMAHHMATFNPPDPADTCKLLNFGGSPAHPSAIHQTCTNLQGGKRAAVAAKKRS